MSMTPPPIPSEEPRCGCIPPVPRLADSVVPPAPAPEPATAYSDEPMPRTYFVWLLVSILLCVVTAVIGLVFSSRVSQRWRAGDIDGARRASDDARLMLIASVVLGLINVPYIMLYYALS